MWFCGLIRRGSAEKRRRKQDASSQQDSDVTEVHTEPPGPEGTLENAHMVLRDASALLVVFQNMPCPVSLVLRDTGELILQNRPSVKLWGDLRVREPLLEVLFRFADEDVLATALAELANSGQWKGLLRVPATVDAACSTTTPGDGALARKSWMPPECAPTLPSTQPAPSSPSNIELHTKPTNDLRVEAVALTPEKGLSPGCRAASPTSDAHPASCRVTAVISTAATESTNGRQMSLTGNGSSAVREQSTTSPGSGALCLNRAVEVQGHTSVTRMQREASQQDAVTCPPPREERLEEQRQSSVEEILLSLEDQGGGGGDGSTADKLRHVSCSGHTVPLTSVQPPPIDAVDWVRALAAPDALSVLPPDNTNRDGAPWLTPCATSNNYTAANSSTALPGSMPSTSAASISFFTPCNSVPMPTINAPTVAPVVPKDGPPNGHKVVSERVERLRCQSTMISRSRSTVDVQDTAVSAPGLALAHSCRQEEGLSSNMNLASAGNMAVSAGTHIHSVPPQRSEQQQQQALLHALTTSAWGTMMKSSCGRRLPRRTSSVQMLMHTSGASFSSAVSGAGPRKTSIQSAIHEKQPRTMDWQTEAAQPSGPYSAAAARVPHVSEMAGCPAAHAAGGADVGGGNGPTSISWARGSSTPPSASYIDMCRRTCFDGRPPQSGLRPYDVQDLQLASAPNHIQSITARAPAVVSASIMKQECPPEPAQQDGSPAHSNMRCGLASSSSMGTGNGAMARILSITLATVGSKNSLRQRISSAAPLNALLQVDDADSGPINSSHSPTQPSEATQRQSFTAPHSPTPLASPRETADHKVLAAPATGSGSLENKADTDWAAGGEGEAVVQVAQPGRSVPHAAVEHPTLEAVDHRCNSNPGQVGGVKVFTRGGSNKSRTPNRVSEAQILTSLDLRPDPANLHGTVDSETAMLMYREAFDKIERPVDYGSSSGMALASDSTAAKQFTPADGRIQRRGRLALHGSTFDSLEGSPLHSPTPGQDVTLTLTLGGPRVTMDTLSADAGDGKGHEWTSPVSVSVGGAPSASLLQAPLLPVVPLHEIVAGTGVVDAIAQPNEPSNWQQTPSQQQHALEAAGAAGASAGDQTLAKSVMVHAAVILSPQPSVSHETKVDQLGLDIVSGGGAGSRLQPPSVVASARAEPPQQEGEMAAETEEKDFRWHEVALTCFEHPQLQRQVVLVVQNDVSERIWAERQLVRVVEAEHTLLENIFPHHVIEHIATTAATKATGASEMETPDLMLLNARLSHTGPTASGGIGSLAAVGDEGVRDPGRLPAIRGDTFLHLATSHTAITVLFCDIQGFTPMCNEVRPVVVMSFLNDLFTRLDAMLDKYGVYKVETIGDCYVAAGGLMKVDEETGAVTVRSDDVDPQHAHRTVQFAKALLGAARHVRLPTSGQPVRLRVGIHSGPAMSGVVGTRMPRFCLFGDTMNTASRMESTGVPGAIHVSQTTRDLVPDEKWEPTGGVPVKGKGTMNTFLLKP